MAFGLQLGIVDSKVKRSPAIYRFETVDGVSNYYFPLGFRAKGVTVDWGDGTVEYYEDVNVANPLSFGHGYEYEDGYLIKVEADEITALCYNTTLAHSRYSQIFAVHEFIGHSVKDLSYAFHGLQGLEYIDRFSLKGVTNMQNFASNCPNLNMAIFSPSSGPLASSLSKITSAFDGSGVLDYVEGFYPSPLLTSINAENTFRGCIRMSSNLSDWCVPNIPTEPAGFSENTPSWASAVKPIWGTCPS